MARAPPVICLIGSSSDEEGQSDGGARAWGSAPGGAPSPPSLPQRQQQRGPSVPAVRLRTQDEAQPLVGLEPSAVDAYNYSPHLGRIRGGEPEADHCARSPRRVKVEAGEHQQTQTQVEEEE
jgi:hypothetical protein